MNHYYEVSEWSIATNQWDPRRQRVNESVFSIGNAAMGIRANFEEDYSGVSLRGSYLAGVYYPDKTRVGWWKNGYPEYFAKILNAVNWIGIHLRIDGQLVDWAQVSVQSFRQELNFHEGVLYKTIDFELNNRKFRVDSQRFCSMAQKTLAGLVYNVQLLDGAPAQVELSSYLDFDVQNTDANYDEKFWIPRSSGVLDHGGYVHSETKKTSFEVVAAMNNVFSDKNGEHQGVYHAQKEKVSSLYSTQLEAGESLELKKTCILLSSLKEGKADLLEKCTAALAQAVQSSWENGLQEHKACWSELWSQHDVRIKGDVPAQQGIRFCIYHFLQSFDGHDARLNIGPKGFTGEKYGGLSYWDTEAFCFPFVMSQLDDQVALDLLHYRYGHLEKAIENARKLGFDRGAALYPMVTINGEECHNEWEITFEEIHRNGAIAYAIWHHAQYTGKTDYLYNQGLEVLIGIARFWQQRAHFSQHKKAYVILGVTGPNEYENNVNNNWYTNYMARWCLSTTAALCEETSGQATSTNMKVSSDEIASWKTTAAEMYLPQHPEKGHVFLQQDGFLDKDLRPVSSIPEQDIPLHHHWSWDRILRSCFIKQADVLQAMVFFPHAFTKDEMEQNFDFYLPMTLHESSLSPSVYSAIAAWLGKEKEAYELFLRSCRLDIDDYNADANDGLHVTSMPGAWNAVVMGIGGVNWQQGPLEINRNSWPEHWEELSFKLRYRGACLELTFHAETTTVRNTSVTACQVMHHGEPVAIEPGQEITLSFTPSVVA